MQGNSDCFCPRGSRGKGQPLPSQCKEKLATIFDWRSHMFWRFVSAFQGEPQRTDTGCSPHPASIPRPPPARCLSTRLTIRITVSHTVPRPEHTLSTRRHQAQVSARLGVIVRPQHNTAASPEGCSPHSLFPEQSDVCEMGLL